MRKQKLCRSGVVVVLLSATAAACAGSVERGTTGDADSSSGNGGSGGSTSVSNGGNAGGTSNQVTTGEVTTNVTGSTTSISCPAIEPPLGSACAEEGQNCRYENCVAPRYRADRDLYCSGGAWIINFEQSCNLGGCPDPMPALGEWCEPEIATGPCSAVDPCGRVQQAVCEGNAWRLPEGDRAMPDPSGVAGAAGASGDSDEPGIDMGAPLVPTCPGTAPAVASDCCPDNHPAVCEYTSGDAAPVPPGGDTGTATSGFPPPTLDCAVCGYQMEWEACQ